MSGCQIHGSYHGAVVVEDDNGVGILPILELKSAYQHANERDAARASIRGRFYDRETLSAAWDQSHIGLGEISECAHEDKYRSCEEPALAGRFCYSHAKDD